jgi:hypothetical protein
MIDGIPAPGPSIFTKRTWLYYWLVWWYTTTSWEPTNGLEDWNRGVTPSPHKSFGGIPMNQTVMKGSRRFQDWIDFTNTTSFTVWLFNMIYVYIISFILYMFTIYIYNINKTNCVWHPVIYKYLQSHGFQGEMSTTTFIVQGIEDWNFSNTIT